MRKIYKYVILFFVLLATYLLFMLGSCLLPNAPIRKHVQQSAESLPCDYPFGMVEKKACQMDNFTDALILNQAYYVNSDDLRTSMLLVPRYQKGMVFTSTLRKVVSEDLAPNIPYARYWHGSTFLTRFLLLIFDFNSIRYLLYYISSFLFIALGVMLFRHVGWISMFAFLSGFIFLRSFIMQFSMQFFPVLSLALIGSMAVCNRQERGRTILPIFFVVGSLTAFFDLLTVPIITLCAPLTVYLLLNQRVQEEAPLLTGVKKMVSFSAIWAIAYGTTWFSKWVLATLFTSENIIQDGFSQFLYRAGTEAEFSRLSALSSNFNFLPLTYIIVIAGIILLFVIFAFRTKGYKNSLFFAMIMTFPYLWYLVAANHSYIHDWFTYRSQILSVSCLFLMLLCLVDKDKVQQLFLRLLKNKKVSKNI